ncbi:uncharacterized protein LOC126792048 [Argentina anserina]|uniref:uncharacterized protein LOC126792048 n=1 Tax=Argentina anserina TaxID=57926 RepID=UPI002176879A|nr:uncharacterized protein LOC126792048 [Potentilla anserina]
MDMPNLLENEKERVIAEDDQQDACDDINMQEEGRNSTKHVEQDARGDSDMEDACENIDMQEEDDQHGSSEKFDFSSDIDDLGNWEKIEHNSRDFIVERGPKREKDHNKILLGQLGNERRSDWKNVSARLASHERNKHHLSCFTSWIELEIRLKNNATVDQGLEEQIKKELEHWRQLLANEVKASIVATIKEAKYFSVILDSTLDASHEEKMSLIGRCVDVTASSIVVREFFLGFLKVNDTMRLGLFNELTNSFDSHTLNISNIRGQGYDNGSNMRGKHKGVHNILLEVNSGAFFTPYGYHSLNLAICVMVNCNPKAD